MMKPHKRSWIISVAVLAPLLLIAVIHLAWGQRESVHPPSHASPPSAPAAAPSPPPLSSAAASTAANFTPPQAEVNSPPAAPHEDALSPACKMGANEPQVLWQEEQRMIYVQNYQLYYTKDGTAKQVLHDWKTALPCRAWLNGDELMIAAQLPEADAGESQLSGVWLIVQTGAAPAVLYEESELFGPREVLAVGLVEDPCLFFVKARSGSDYVELVFDTSSGRSTAFSGRLDAEWANQLEPDVYALSVLKVYRLPGDRVIYAFKDKDSVVLYDGKPYWVRRYRGLELVDVKLMPQLEDPPQLTALLRDEAGAEWLSHPNDLVLLPAPPGMWQEDWKALNAFTFTHVSSGKLEAIQYEEKVAGREERDDPPRRIAFSTEGAKLLSTEGTLLTYGINGVKQSISWYDLIHAENAKPEELWSSSLPDFAELTTKQTTRPPWSPNTVSHQIPAWSFEGLNTNAPIPEKLMEALDKAYREEDYGYAKAFRKWGPQWYVLIDNHFYSFKDGALKAIGDMPITLAVQIGEAAGGHGARDFVRWKDAWYVADTEASRVVKLNDKLEVEAELAVPTPYRLTVKGG
ncbi:hypothetical protein [Paenibacillus sp. R14(2021)]|uniref:hypothetical protein n=1 Tax=Paenibacillus sp. R14(2021) TaxID=2859228 RepID=UPI001C612DF4|nr:hypothetical protein [Paenibacillus sp. R14(2021)]